MIRRYLVDRVEQALQRYPAVVILGPRQVGKTTLAQYQLSASGKPRLYLDLERPSDLAKLSDAEFFLSRYSDHVVVIDEVQRMPELFPILRSLIDEHRQAGRFVLLGSASDALIRASSESLAGRVSYLELHPFSTAEVGADAAFDLWIRGGYPPAFLATNEEEAFEWPGDFVRTHVERELGATYLRATATELSLFLRMLVSVHGQLTNYSELAKSLQLSAPTVKNYVHFFEQAFLIRTLLPFHANVQKRLVKSPKLYFRDSGVLHYLRGITSLEQLEGDMLKGPSWEGFVIQQIMALLKPELLPFFYRTSAGAEVDLVLLKGNRPYVAFEIKYTNSPRATKETTEALKDLNCPHSFVVTPSAGRYELRPGLWVISLSDLLPVLKEIGAAY